MKKDIKQHKFNSIADAHKAFGLPEPLHPLVSLINGEKTKGELDVLPGQHVLSFYKVSYKPQVTGKLKYGQNYYDFESGGGLMFAAPNQVIGSNDEEDLDAGTCSQFTLYSLLIHPDFLLGHPLAKTIKQYGFFSYSVFEALHLSEEERATVLSIFSMIETELASRLDDFSQDVVLSQIDLLLNFANRFYKRQFITRKAVNNDLLQRFEALVDDHLNNKQSQHEGLPTVTHFAEQLNLSPGYLSDMLRSLTGLNAQQHIQNKLIDKAKEILSTTNLSVTDVAYTLGFEYSQSFSKLFKNKTNLSPLEFRQSFN